MSKISQFFSEDEFKCKCNKCDAKIDPYFVLRLDEVRQHVGKPVIITSGVRCPDWNHRCGGSKNSYHVKGLAADIYCPTSRDRFLLLEAANKLGFGGIGIGKTFIHLDIRASDGVCWIYDTQTGKAISQPG